MNVGLLDSFCQSRSQMDSEISIDLAIKIWHCKNHKLNFLIYGPIWWSEGLYLQGCSELNYTWLSSMLCDFLIHVYFSFLGFLLCKLVREEVFITSRRRKWYTFVVSGVPQKMRWTEFCRSINMLIFNSFDEFFIE